MPTDQMRFIAALDDGTVRSYHASTNCIAADKDSSEPLVATIANFDKQHQVECMAVFEYPDTDGTFLEAVAIALSDGSIQILDVDDGEVLLVLPSSQSTNEEDDRFVSLEYINGTLCAARSAGLAVFTNIQADRPPESYSVSLPGPLAVVRMDPHNPGVIAFGGKENDLQVWSIKGKSTTQPVWDSIAPLWKARNVKNDDLDLRVPIWLSDICFLGDTTMEELHLITSTRFQHIREYRSSHGKRPLKSYDLGQHPITHMILLRDTVEQVEVIISDTQSTILHVELPKGIIRGSYKGSSGATSAVHTLHDPYKASSDQAGGVLVTGSMDGYLRAYNIFEHKLLCSIYTTSRIRAIVNLPNVPTIKNEDEDEDEDEDTDAEDDVWEGLEDAVDEQVVKRRKM